MTQKGHFVRIGSRCETPAFDWEKPVTWHDALAGMESVYINYQPDLAIPKALASIKAFTAKAVESGIQQMVILSGRGEKEAQLCEEVVTNAAANWTVVRADWFYQNFSESFFLDPILAGYLALPQANTRIPFIDTGDIAEVVVKALTETGHEKQVYEITGPQLLTFKQDA